MSPSIFRTGRGPYLYERPSPARGAGGAQRMFQVREHFTSPQWVDLVRGQLAEEVATEMDRHLRAGCTTCVAAFDAWQGLAVFAREEREIAPPDDVVRVVKSYLAQRRFSDPVPGARPIVAWASATLATAAVSC